MRLTIVSLYESWMDGDGGDLIRVMNGHGFDVETMSFYRRHRPGKINGKAAFITLQIGCLVKLVLPFFRLSRGKVLCMGGHYAWLLMTRLFSPILPAEFHLYISNYYLHSLGKSHLVRSVMRFLLDSQKVTVIVQSPGELRYYAQLCANPPRFVPYGEADYALATNFDLVPEAPYLFTGGYSNRDYGTVLKCAATFPEFLFVMAGSALNEELVRVPVPANVVVFQDIDNASFYGLLEKSLGVILPLRDDVGSSGQMVCIAAMRFAKPIIYTNVSSINYFFKEGVSGLPFEMADAQSLAGAVARLQGMSEQAAEQLGIAARSDFLAAFTKDRRYEKLFEVMTDNVERLRTTD